MQWPNSVVAIGMALALAVPAAPAEAGKRGVKPHGPFVVSCSTYGNGCTAAPVRRGKWGPEMRLKGGTWIDCERDCRETLRVKTVDFWETLRELGN